MLNFPLDETIVGVDVKASEDTGRLIEISFTLGNGGKIQITPIGERASLYMRVDLPNSLTATAWIPPGLVLALLPDLEPEHRNVRLARH